MPRTITGPKGCSSMPAATTSRMAHCCADVSQLISMVSPAGASASMVAQDEDGGFLLARPERHDAIVGGDRVGLVAVEEQPVPRVGQHGHHVDGASRPAHRAVDCRDDVQLALGHLVGLDPHDIVGTDDRTGPHDAPGRHDRMQVEPVAGVERHRLRIAGALNGARALRVSVGEGEAKELAPDPLSLHAGHGTELREHPVVLAYEGLGHADDGAALVLRHPGTARIGAQEMAGPVDPAPFVLDGVPGDREAMTGQHGQEPTLEGRHRPGGVGQLHRPERHHQVITPRARRRDAGARTPRCRPRNAGKVRCRPSH